MKTRSILLVLLTLAVLAPLSLAPRLAHATTVACDSSKTVLLIQDITPWAGTTNHNPSGADVNELTAQHAAFCSINSSQLSAYNLAQFQEIVIPSAQNQNYYNNLFPSGSIHARISSWVSHGGVLLANLADCGSATGAGGGWSTSACRLGASSYAFVGGVKHVGSFSDENTVVTSSSPVVTGRYGGGHGGQISDTGCVKDLDCWGWSSHAYFTNLPSGTTIILNEPHGPVFIEYRYGDGLVIATTTSVEWRYDYSQPASQNLKLLANAIGYENFKTVCQEKDGDGDFNGNHGKGHFHVDNDQCEDGDPNQVSSSDRGDGKSFQSTQIQTTQFQSTTMPRTLTVTGLGVTGGLPVAFTFVAIETGPTTPGVASFVFSDGFSNVGPLTSGSILLHGW